MDSIVKGNIAEATVLNGFVRIGCRVMVPFSDGHPYDLAVDLGTERLLRVQCKSARLRGSCLVFNSRATDHGRGRLSYHRRADVFATCHPATGRVYVVPVESDSGFEISLRLEPTRNNQRRRVRYADEHALETVGVHGLIGLLEAPASAAAA